MRVRRAVKQSKGRTRTHMYQVARYPVLLPGDVTIWTPKKLDPSVKYAPRGGIVCCAADPSSAALGDGVWGAWKSVEMAVLYGL